MKLNRAILGKILNSFLSFTLVSLLALTSLLVAPAPPARADTATAVTVSSITLALTPSGGPDVTGTTDVTVNGYVGATNGLGAYDFKVNFDATKVQVTAVAGSDTAGSPFSGVPTNNLAQANTTGQLFINAFHTTVPGPTGNIKVARITWKSIAGGVHTLTPVITTLADTAGGNVTGAVATAGTITTTTVRAGTGSVNIGATADIPITIAGVPAAGLGSYSISIAFDQTKFTVQSVLDGAAPFGAPATKTIGTGTVTLADSQTGATPTGDIVVASLRVSGVAAATNSPLTVTVTSVTNAAAAAFSPTPAAENGAVTVTALAIESSSITVNVGTTATSTITLKDPPPAGIKSYNITVAFDATKLTLASTAAGDAPFGTPVFAAGAGTVTISQTIAAPFATATVVVARLNFTGTANTTAPVSLAITVNSMTDGADAAKTPLVVNGTATVTTPVVKIATGNVNTGANTDLNLTVEGLAGQSLKSYNVTVAFDNTKVTVNAVTGGTAPFNTPASNINNNAGTVAINQTITTGFPTGNVTVARINFQGVAGGASNLTVTVTALTNSADGNITRTITNGAITVLATRIEIGSAFLMKGASTDISITVKQVPAPTGTPARGGLGSYDFRIDYNKDVLRVNSFSVGTDPVFAAAPFTWNADNATGRAFVNQFQTASAAGPSGDILVAKMNVTAIASGTTNLTLATLTSTPPYPMTLSDTTGADIAHTRLAGAITAYAFDAGIKVGIKGGTVQVPVTVKVPAGTNGLGSYAATISFDKTKIRIDSVADGDAPFGAPTTKTIDNNAGTVTLADSQTGAAPTGTIIVATLNATALETTVTSLSNTTASPVTVNLTALTDAATTPASPAALAGGAGSVQVVPVPTVTIASDQAILNQEKTLPVTVAVHESLVPSGIGAYDFTVGFDPTKIVPGATFVTGGAGPFATATITVGNPVDVNANLRTIRFNSFHTTKPGPKASFVIANLTFRPTVGGVTTTVTLTVNTLSDVDGNPPLTATAVNSTLTITAPSAAPAPAIVIGGGAPPPVATPPPVTVPTVTAPVVAKVTVGIGADGTDDKGNRAPGTPGKDVTITTVAGTLTLEIPASTSRDATLASFNDPTSGVKFEGQKLTMPIKDDKGNVVITITATTDPAKGQGSSAQAPVKTLQLQTAPVRADVPKSVVKGVPVGQVSSFVKAVLKSLPSGASVTVSSLATLPVQTQNAFSSAAKAANNSVVDIAFGISVTKAVLQDVTDVGAATVSMNVAKAWVDAFGADKIAIARLSDAGDPQLLPTKMVGTQDNTVAFEGTSTLGLSTFALVALQTAPAQVVPTETAPAPPTVVPPPPKPTPTAPPAKPTPTAPPPKPTPTAKPTTPPPPPPPTPKPEVKPTTPPPIVQPITPPPPKPTVVTPAPTPTPVVEQKGPSVGLIIGIAVAVIIVIILVWALVFRKRKKQEED